jgi:hypothetical protein
MIREFKDEYSWLSNFYPCNIEYEGVIFDSVEKAYQSAKTNDHQIREEISRLSSPGKAKRFFKNRTEDVREDWNKVNLGIMRELLHKKFVENDYFRRKLLSTGNSEIQEGNWWGDRFFGVDLKTGEGQNLLGKMIMDIRKEIREEGEEN